MIKKIVVISILLLVIVQLIAWPVYAYVGAVKVATDAALALAKKEAVQEAIAIAAAAGGGVAVRSIAVRVLTSGVPWLAIGIPLATIAYQTYYSSNDLNTLYSSVAGQEGWYNPTGGSAVSVNPDNNHGFGSVLINQSGSTVYLCGMEATTMDFQSRHVRKTAGTDETQQQFYDRMGFPVGSGWSWGQCGSPGAGYVYEWYFHSSSVTYNTTDAEYQSGSATATDIENWFASNPTSSFNPDNRYDPVGVGVSPQPADDVVSVPLSVGDVALTTKNVAEIGDVVLGDGFPPVGDVVQTDTQVTTRDTVVDPVTGQEEITETAQSTCSSGGHDERTLGTVLQNHLMSWQNTPLLTSLSALQNITFPADLPVVSLPSSIFGNQEIDFSEFAWMFTAVKIILIGVTSLYSYKIVFGGG